MLGGQPRRAAHPARIPFVHTDKGLALAPDTADELEVVGWIYAFNRHLRTAGSWAPTSRTLDPTFTYEPVDGSAPTPADIAQARALYADELRDRFKDPQLAAAVRTNTASTVPLVSGYIHNAATLLILFAFLTSAYLATLAVLHLRRRQHAATSGRCTTCLYDRRGLTPESPCPECGARATTCPVCGRGPFMETTCPDCGVPTNA